MLKVYNTLTKKKEEFAPLKSPQVTMYACGVTVYDNCHIGHARSLYVFEVIRRYLAYRGYTVRFVRNITDVDDKIIDKARQWAAEQGISLQDAFDKVRTTYIESYHKDLEALGIPRADFEPKATENIKEMQEYIGKLIAKGFAYKKEDGVYFSPKKYSTYGNLSGNTADQMVSGSSDFSKEDALDFALWKSAKPDEPSWKSPWGNGRPGWHIECSVMSQKYLQTETLDIHGGGRDLIFPHHENERAQSEACTGKSFARYWMHHGLLTIDKQKMAKSLGNFITISDFIKTYKDPDFLKLFFLSAHYSQPIDFNETKLHEVRKQKKTFYDLFDNIDCRVEVKQRKASEALSQKDKAKIDSVCTQFTEAMDDDFNTPRALASLFELADLGATFASGDNDKALHYINEKMETFFGIFGLKRKKTQPIPAALKKKVIERNKARADKDFKKADEIRSEIEKNSKYIIADTGSAVAFIEKELPDE